MILIEIKRYLAAKESANLQELALHFKQPPAVMRDMLCHWVRKGKVTKIAKPIGCGTKCTQCAPSFAEVYRWNVETNE